MSVSIPYPERLAASLPWTGRVDPFFTVTVPHFKHRRYVELVLESIFAQDYNDLEIVISDDMSPDDSRQVLPSMLERSGVPFRYYAQPSNLGYDGNLRFCLAAAQGRYVFLLGNDDALAGPSTLRDLAACLHELNLPAVAITNYADWQTNLVTKRAQATQLLGTGPETAIQFFRSFSFFSGLIFEREAAHRHETDLWDRSVFYQIYLATRIIASGRQLGAIELCTVRKDVRLDGQTVPNYATLWTGAPWSLQPRHTGMDSVIRVAVDGVVPMIPPARQSGAIRRIVGQILVITYPYWLLEYRRVANWSFAMGISRAMWPGRLLDEYRSRLAWPDRIGLWIVYAGATIAGLFTPAGLFQHAQRRIADSLRRWQQSPQALSGLRRNSTTGQPGQTP